MPLEEELAKSAMGDFNAMLIVFLVITLVSGFWYMIKSLLDQNAKHNQDILNKMEIIVQTIKDYKCDTMDMLKAHDEQARCIKNTLAELKTTLQNRPCIKDR